MSKLGPTFGLKKQGLSSAMSGLRVRFLSLMTGVISVVSSSAPLATSCMTMPCVECVVPEPGVSSFRSKLSKQKCMSWSEEKYLGGVLNHLQ